MSKSRNSRSTTYITNERRSSQIEQNKEDITKIISKFNKQNKDGGVPIY